MDLYNSDNTDSNSSSEFRLPPRSDKESVSSDEVADSEETGGLLREILCTEALAEERMDPSARYYSHYSNYNQDAVNACLSEQNRQIQDRDNAPPGANTVAMDTRRGVHVYEFMDDFHETKPDPERERVLEVEHFTPDPEPEPKLIESYQDLRDDGHKVETVAVDGERGVHVYTENVDPNPENPRLHVEPLWNSPSGNARMLDFQDMARDGVPTYSKKPTPFQVWHCMQCNVFRGYATYTQLAGRYCGNTVCLSHTKWHTYKVKEGQPAWCPELVEVYTFRDGMWVQSSPTQSPLALPTRISK